MDSHSSIRPFAIQSSVEAGVVEMRSHPGIESEHDVEFLIHPHDSTRNAQHDSRTLGKQLAGENLTVDGGWNA